MDEVFVLLHEPFPLLIHEEKAPLGLRPGPVRKLVEAPLAPPEAASGRLVIAPESVIDLTAKVQPDGTLEWVVPPGEWAIVRTGFGCNNDQIMCASPGAAGPSVDFLSKAATDFHFQNTAEILLQDAGPLAVKTLKYFHDDSWEAGLPNWTGSFLDDFKKYLGYDARPYLPVLAGHLITSEEVSDRFLYDFRKTMPVAVLFRALPPRPRRRHAEALRVVRTVLTLNPTNDVPISPHKTPPPTYQAQSLPTTHGQKHALASP